MADTTYKSTVRDLSSATEGAADVAADFAGTVSDVASRAQKQAAALGNRAVDAFNDTASYIREHDMSEIAEDVKSWVKSNPTQALIAAAALGFVAGTLLRRR